MIKVIVCLVFVFPALLMAEDNATVIVFVEQEKNIDPYQTRMLVTNKYLRIDEGAESLDYILLNRDENIIYNVNSESETVMQIEMMTGKISPPYKLELTKKEVELPVGAPAIGGIKPRHFRLSTNETLCVDVISVKGILGDVVNAMRQYNNILASNNASTLHATPEDARKPCMLSKDIFHVNQVLGFGFPIQEWTPSGKTRVLLDYTENKTVNPGLFDVPNNYQSYSIKDFREGRVRHSE